MDGDPGLPPTEVRPTPDELAGDEDNTNRLVARIPKWPGSSSGRDRL